MMDDLPRVVSIPCKPAELFIGKEKIMLDTSDDIWFGAHQHEAHSLFVKLNILTKEQFDDISWEHVHPALTGMPKMFQIFACKQAFNMSAVLNNLAKQKDYDHLGRTCPSCRVAVKTTGNILMCPELGCSKSLHQQHRRVFLWLCQVDTNPQLTDLLTQFLFTWGITMDNSRIYHPPPVYVSLLRSLENIGWGRLMEGMLPHALPQLDQMEILGPCSMLSVKFWMIGLVSKLLEAPHGQWMYRNLTFHDHTSGLIATKAKYQLQQDTEHQIILGGEVLSESDEWMLEIDLGKLDSTSGVRNTIGYSQPGS
jgi:hypothetical protein